MKDERRTHVGRWAVVVWLLLMLHCSWFVSPACAQQADNYRSRLRNRNVKIEQTNLPIVFINVSGRMILRDSYILGRMKIIHNGDGQLNYADTVGHPGQTIDYEGYIALKYRGNTSFDQSDKKPFAFRTLETNVLPDYGGQKQKVKILGMKKDNKWGFIAPWCDEAMVRDVLSFELARPWFDWVPHARFCEVILDGTYYGVYALCERVSKGKHRLDLNDPGADNGDLTGDYHVSVDHGYDPYYTSKHHPWQSLDGSRVATWYTIKYEYEDPEDDEFWEMPDGTREALHAEIDKMEDAFAADNWQDPVKGYRSHVDVQSFIDYMLATELAMNIDGYRLSTHLYKHSDTRALTDGVDARWKTTLWDFNIAWGNADYYDGDKTDRWQYMLNINHQGDGCPVPFYWYRMLQDTAYVSAMKQRWQQYRQTNHADEALMATVDSLTRLLTANGASARNEQAWGIFSRDNIWPIPYYAGNYTQAVQYLKNWIRQRPLFMAKHLLPPRVIQTTPLAAAGWNADIVVDRLPAAQSTTITIDGSNRTFYSAQVRASGGLPSDGVITSNNEGVRYQLGDYDGANALSLHDDGATGTLLLKVPAATSELFILATSGNGASMLTVTLNYTDGTSDDAGTYTVRDWSVRQPQGDEAVTALGNIVRDNNQYSSDNHYCLFDFSVPVDADRLLESVTFTANNGAYAAIMALSMLVGDQTDIAEVWADRGYGGTDGRGYGGTGVRGYEGTYDLQGRPLPASSSARHASITILRSADGTVRKVVR